MVKVIIFYLIRSVFCFFPWSGTCIGPCSSSILGRSCWYDHFLITGHWMPGSQHFQASCNCPKSGSYTRKLHQLHLCGRSHSLITQNWSSSLWVPMSPKNVSPEKSVTLQFVPPSALSLLVTVTGGLHVFSFWQVTRLSKLHRHPLGKFPIYTTTLSFYHISCYQTPSKPSEMFLLLLCSCACRWENRLNAPPLKGPGLPASQADQARCIAAGKAEVHGMFLGLTEQPGRWGPREAQVHMLSAEILLLFCFC